MLHAVQCGIGRRYSLVLVVVVATLVGITSAQCPWMTSGSVPTDKCNSVTPFNLGNVLVLNSVDGSFESPSVWDNLAVQSLLVDSGTTQCTAPTSGNTVTVLNSTAIRYNAVNTVFSGAESFSCSASLCARCVPSSSIDGDVLVSTGVVSAMRHVYWPGATTVLAGSTTVQVGNARSASSPPANAFAPGTTVILMQMMGVNFYWDSTSPTSMGDGIASNVTGDRLTRGGYVHDSTVKAGEYEYATVVSATANAGGFLVTLSKPLINSYYKSSATLVSGNLWSSYATFQMIRPLQTDNLDLGSTLEALRWDGSTGGVLAIDVYRELRVGSNARLSASERGFRGGGGRTSSNQQVTGREFGRRSQGEGFAGTPIYTYDPVNNVLETNTQTFPKPYLCTSGGYSYAANTNPITAPTCTEGTFMDPRWPPEGIDATDPPGTLGWLQIDRSRISFGNGGSYGVVFDSGGGGGSNVGRGGDGGSRIDTVSGACPNGGVPGALYTEVSQSKFVMGGGGGSFGDDNEAADLNLSSGGTGGGIILVRAATIKPSTGSETLIIDSNGGTVASSSVLTEGRGGGGAGGSILIFSLQITARITATANGGNGGSTSESNDGGGGGGGGGFISISSSTTPTFTPSLSAVGGNAGSGGNVATPTCDASKDGVSGSSGNGLTQLTVAQWCCTASTTTSVTVVARVVASGDSLLMLQGTSQPVSVLSNDVGNISVASTTVTTPSPVGSTSVSSGVITFTPVTTFNSTTSFVYRICGVVFPTDCSSATVTVTVVPTVHAVADSVKALQETPLSINVLSNDYGNVSVPSTTVVAQSSHGVATVNSGVITFTPNAGYSGVTTFDYRICGVSFPLDCSTTTVTVTVIPFVIAQPDYRTFEIAPQTLTVLSNDTGPLNANSVTIINTPSIGSATVQPGGSITYTPVVGGTGPVSFKYRVCSTEFPTDCTNTTVYLTVLDSLSAVDDHASTLPITDVTLNVLANDLGPKDFASLRVVTAPPSSVGSIIMVSSTTGEIAFRPAPGFFGNATIPYEVCSSLWALNCKQANFLVSVSCSTDIQVRVSSNTTDPVVPFAHLFVVTATHLGDGFGGVGSTVHILSVTITVPSTPPTFYRPGSATCGSYDDSTGVWNIDAQLVKKNDQCEISFLVPKTFVNETFHSYFVKAQITASSCTDQNISNDVDTLVVSPRDYVILSPTDGSVMSMYQSKWIRWQSFNPFPSDTEVEIMLLTADGSAQGSAAFAPYLARLSLNAYQWYWRTGPHHIIPGDYRIRITAQPSGARFRFEPIITVKAPGLISLEHKN